jgi:hypothetical protein
MTLGLVGKGGAPAQGRSSQTLNYPKSLFKFDFTWELSLQYRLLKLLSDYEF